MNQVLIVAHGQPSDPDRAEAELGLFAAQVAALLPTRVVKSATLATPQAIEQAVATLGRVGLVFPMFMAGGWFTRIHLPKRLRAAGGQGWRVLEPLGCDPALHDLAAQLVAEAYAGTSSGPVLLAAHGSFKSPVPSDIAHHVAGVIARKTGAQVEAAFIDQDPQLSAATGYGPDTICLPFFAACGGHVAADIPAALARAGFQGRLLPALGLDARVPQLVARAITAAQPVCVSECRFKRGVRDQTV